MNKVTIDATQKQIGRVASEAAHTLMGKDTPAFVRNAFPKREVHIIHASKMKIVEKKRIQKEYKRFSGYPSGLKQEPMEKLIAKKGYSEVVRKAVYGMLPSNKLRAKMMKHLIVTE